MANYNVYINFLLQIVALDDEEESNAGSDDSTAEVKPTDSSVDDKTVRPTKIYQHHIILNLFYTHAGR